MHNQAIHTHTAFLFAITRYTQATPYAFHCHSYYPPIIPITGYMPPKTGQYHRQSKCVSNLVYISVNALCSNLIHKMQTRSLLRNSTSGKLNENLLIKVAKSPLFKHKPAMIAGKTVTSQIHPGRDTLQRTWINGKIALSDAGRQVYTG